MIGQGRRKRVARITASSWVLSPISAMATTNSETRRECMGSPALAAARAGGKAAE